MQFSYRYHRSRVADELATPPFNKGAKRVLASLFFLSFPALNIQAGAFEPVIELFRMGPADHLIVDRGGPVDNAGDINRLRAT